MSKRLDDLIDGFAHNVAVISPRLHGYVRRVWGRALKSLSDVKMRVSRFVYGLRRIIAEAVRRFKVIPALVKLQVVLLCVTLFFFFWQFFAYEFSQTTFITMNLVLAAALTSAISAIGIRSQKRVETSRLEAKTLSEQLARSEADLDRLRTELFEIRNKGRRQSAVGKGSVWFVDTVKKLKLKAHPDAESMQYVIDALGVCFEITGAVVFARDADDASSSAISGDDTKEDESDNQGVFRIAGRFGLSDTPPTTIVTSGDGILGQVVENNEPLTLEKVPAEYLSALSGLGRSRNVNVYALPLVRGDKGRVEAVVEVASFEKLQIVEAWSSIEQQLSEII